VLNIGVWYRKLCALDIGAQYKSCAHRILARRVCTKSWPYALWIWCVLIIGASYGIDAHVGFRKEEEKKDTTREKIVL
jgi:hypothetical protein